MSLDLRQAAEAAQLLMERREQDGLARFLGADPGPFVHQRALWESTKSEAWLFGANRSGKSEALAAMIASFLRFGVLNPLEAFTRRDLEVKPVRVWAISLDFDMSRNILQPRIFNNGAGLGALPFIPDSEIASWNVTNQMLILKNGSICIFKSVDSGRNHFMGADIDLAGFDEVPEEPVHREVAIRVGGGRKLFIRGAATILPPVGQAGGVSWMFPAKVQPWLDKGGTKAERNEKSPHLDIFTAKLRDNTTILPEQVAQVCSQYAPGSPEYLIRVEGELLPSIGGAPVYPNFLRTFHHNPALAPIIEGRPTPRVHPFHPLCLAVDFNPADGVWIVGQYIDQVFRVIDEICLERSDIAPMCYEFRGRFPAHTAELWIYGDATGRRPETQTGESNFHLMQQYLAGYPAPIRFQLPAINPPQSDRAAAVNLQLRSPDGMRRVEIAPHCTVLTEDLELTKWKANGKIDKKGKLQSNGADCLGYWISVVCPTVRFGQTTKTLKSVRSPSYAPSTRAFPATVSYRGAKGRAFVARMR